MKKIVLITSGQPSTNPRLVKEADALIQQGYEVTVIYQYISAWATQTDIQLLKGKSWRAICVGGNPVSEKLPFILTRLIQKFSTIIIVNLGLYNFFAKFAIGRCGFWLERAAKNNKADIYIAHNLAALPAAFYAAKKHKANLGFDAEDFHRNEVSDNPNNFDVKLKTFIEDSYYKYLDYFTTSSELIAKAYENLYPNLKPIVIHNVFEIEYQPTLILNKAKSLRLFWFSQTIGKNRGLEGAIFAINNINNPLIELHLLGNYSSEIITYFNDIANFKINYYPPIPGHAIFDFASQFDIGLALEPGFCLNNKLALSNKIFTYLISGLAIISSNTDAQKEFILQNPQIGPCFKIGDVNELSTLINNFIKDKASLNSLKKESYLLAQTKYNWEIESSIFFNEIRNL